MQIQILSLLKLKYSFLKETIADNMMECVSTRHFFLPTTSSPLDFLPMTQLMQEKFKT
uniref:Uncharacterized protein n=1 Tax=Nelumbo nucifera TaxID=4432 RepID=A0A822YMK1_NELNU|nr:TPA_asm: hypothetical protein HUJ06_011096 [Nelumbo nucifera]